MDDLKCGDVCICDLSLSMNTHKYSVVPLVFISVSWKEETPIYAFCRIGKAPEAARFFRSVHKSTGKISENQPLSATNLK